MVNQKKIIVINNVQIRNGSILTIGNVRRQLEKNNKNNTNNVDDMIVANCVRVPTRFITADRANDPEHGQQRKNDENILAVPNAINSWLADTSQPCSLANVLPNENVDMNDTNEINMALAHNFLIYETSGIFGKP